MLTVAAWLMAVAGFSVALIVLRERTMRIEAIERACHELRGPLTAARLGLALGLRTGELSRERLQAIELELGRAGLVVEDVADAGGASVCLASMLCERERVDVGDLVAQSVEAWRPAAQHAGVAIELSWRGGPALIRGDRLRIAQATGNLIANAIEHGRGPIRVSGGLHQRRVRIEVDDRGAGLPAPIAQVARRARRGRRGRGRGLGIAGAIIEAQGGRLASAPSEHGARLVIDLPAAEAQDEVKAPVA